MTPDAPLQLAFARHLRDPQAFPAPSGLDPQRVATYRRLFFNNLESVLSANFPVMARLLAGEPWRQLIRRFYADHPSKAPLFTELSREFVGFLGSCPDLPRPFLAELAHYEWVELALMLDTHELTQIPADRSGDPLQREIVVSPCAWLLAYRFPVHALRPEFQPEVPPAEPTFLVVYRDRKDHIGFMALNRASARLLELLQAQSATSGLAAIGQLAAELGMRTDQVLAHALEQISLWQARDIVLGVRPLDA